MPWPECYKHAAWLEASAIALQREMISANTKVFSSDVLYGAASKQQKLTPYCHPAPKKGDTQEKSQEEKINRFNGRGEAICSVPQTVKMRIK
jgi:hypothetical protein